MATYGVFDNRATSTVPKRGMGRDKSLHRRNHCKSCYSHDRRLRCESLECRTLLAGDVVMADPVRFGSDTQAVLTVDVNNDGSNDIVVGASGWTTGSVRVYLNDGTGTFRFGASVGEIFDGFEIATADFNGDGFADLATPRGPMGDPFIAMNLGGTGDAWRGFDEPMRIPGIGLTVASATADFNADGLTDLAFSAGRIYVLLNRGHQNGVWQRFEYDGSYPPHGVNAHFLEAGDLNSDGAVDLVTGNYNSSDVSVLLGDGDGTFQEATVYKIADQPEGVRTVSLGDFNNDGHIDVATVVSYTPYVALLFNNGDGGLSDPVYIRCPSNDEFFAIATGDLDGDGDLDLTAHDYPHQLFWVFLNPGDGNLQPQAEPFTGTGPQTYQAVIADLDNDDLPDVVVAASGVTVFLNKTPVDIPGDANRDGVFDSLDLIQALAAGEYDDGIPQNSVWEEGDWNGDAEFDSEDLIAAFAAGNYVTSVDSLPSGLPAAIDLLIAGEN